MELDSRKKDRNTTWLRALLILPFWQKGLNIFEPWSTSHWLNFLVLLSLISIGVFTFILIKKLYQSSPRFFPLISITLLVSLGFLGINQELENTQNPIYYYPQVQGEETTNELLTNSDSTNQALTTTNESLANAFLTQNQEALTTIFSNYLLTTDFKKNLRGDINLHQGELKLKTASVNSRVIKNKSIQDKDIDSNIKLHVNELITKDKIEISGLATFKKGLNITGGGLNVTNGTTFGGDLDMGGNLILNIGNSNTDFTSEGGLNLAGALSASGASIAGNTDIIGNLDVSSDIESSTATITTLDGTTLSFLTANLTTLDLGTNTIIDQQMTGNWDMNAGNLTNLGGISLAGDIALDGNVFSSGVDDNYFLGNVGIGTDSPSYTLDVTGTGRFTGSLTIEGGFIMGTTSTDYLEVNGTLNSHLIPASNNVYDLGSPAYYYRNIYTGTIIANNISAAGTNISGTSSETLALNSDNTTTDSEDSYLIFTRGTVTPNALLYWNSGSDRFHMNQDLWLQDETPTTGSTVLTLQAGENQGSDNLTEWRNYAGSLLAAFSSSGGLTLGNNLVLGSSTLTTTNTTLVSNLNADLLDSQEGSYYLDLTNATNQDQIDHGSISGLLDDDHTQYALLVGRDGESLAIDQIKAYDGAGLLLTDDGGSGIFIQDGGNVGIGTVSPLTLLTVGDIQTAESTVGVLAIKANASNMNVHFEEYSGTESWQLGIDSDGDFNFLDSASATRFSLQDGTGNIGIGTTAPTKKLDIVGDGINLENTTTDSTGIIFKNGSRFIHNFQHPTGGTAIPVGFNTFIGISAGNFTMGSTATETYHGSHNVGVGYSSLQANTTGYANTALGSFSLQANTTGSSNTALGRDSLYSNTTGYHNTALGRYAGRLISTGGDNTTGDQNIFIGYDTRPLADDDQNEIVIGYSAVGVGSNSVVLGNDSITKTILKGNVGIGTTAPGANLDVAATGAKIRISDSANSSYLYLGSAGSNSTTIYSGSNDSLDFGTNGSAGDLFIDASGNVGIGTTSPNSKLEVSQNLDTSADWWTDGQTILRIVNANANGDATLKLRGGTGVGRVVYGWGGSSDKLIFSSRQSTNTAGKMIAFDNNGNVGIGTTSPNRILDIEATGESADIGLSTTDTNNAFLKFATDTAGTEHNGFIGIDYSENTLKLTRDGFDSSSKGIIIDSAGQVGIRTISPEENLHLAGTTPIFKIQDTTTGAVDRDQVFSSINFAARNDAYLTEGNNAQIRSVHLRDGTSHLAADAGLQFLTTSPTESYALTPRMTIDNYGNVGIGTTSPSSKLEIKGVGGNADDFLRLTDSDNSAYARLRTNDGSLIFEADQGATQADSFIRFDVDNSTKVIINSSGYVGIGTVGPSVALDVIGDIEYTGTITDVSDGRLKNNIETLENSLEKIMNLNPVSYQMNDEDTGQTYLGFIAQNVNDYFPEAVSEIDQEGHLGLDYTQLIAPAIASIQEQQTQYDSLILKTDEDITNLEDLQTSIDEQLSTINTKFTNLNSDIENLENYLDTQIAELEERLNTKVSLNLETAETNSLE